MKSIIISLIFGAIFNAIHSLIIILCLFAFLNIPSFSLVRIDIYYYIIKKKFKYLGILLIIIGIALIMKLKFVHKFTRLTNIFLISAKILIILGIFSIFITIPKLKTLEFLNKLLSFMILAIFLSICNSIIFITLINDFFAFLKPHKKKQIIESELQMVLLHFIILLTGLTSSIVLAVFQSETRKLFFISMKNI